MTQNKIAGSVHRLYLSLRQHPESHAGVTSTNTLFEHPALTLPVALEQWVVARAQALLNTHKRQEHEQIRTALHKALGSLQRPKVTCVT
jgi:hypothetical protein